MAIQDIDGARPRFILRQEKKARFGFLQDDARPNSHLHVKDINSMDNKRKFLYQRQGNPLNPSYKLPSLENDQQKVIGPIEANSPKPLNSNQRQNSSANTTLDIQGAQPKKLGAVPKHLAGRLIEGPSVQYFNRNVAHNGDIIANTNENPMVENQEFAASKKKTFLPPPTRRLIRDLPSPTEVTMTNFAKLNLSENK